MYEIFYFIIGGGHSELDSESPYHRHVEDGIYGKEPLARKGMLN